MVYMLLSSVLLSTILIMGCNYWISIPVTTFLLLDSQRGRSLIISSKEGLQYFERRISETDFSRNAHPVDNPFGYFPVMIHFFKSLMKEPELDRPQTK